ncbi:MAG TPA: glycoside hydrolase family 30 beta sandwich domain-containing protein [Candidatus Bathyarchaeia archaeon]|nr:glycoside hydrolase family 30 beta sandwich domain-containing protein [Candidatus Bathyarchaeia archaeon]
MRHLLASLVVCCAVVPAVYAADVASWVSLQDGSQLLAPQAAIPAREAARGEKADIRLDAAKTYQTMLGMGSSFEHTTCANLGRLEPGVRADVVEKLVSPDNGIGMNLMRICIGTPDFTGEPWYSYDDMPPGKKDPGLDHFSIDKDKAYVLPVLKLALEKNPNLLFYASPWSPPGWMKTCDDMIGGHLYPRYYGVYARYFAKFVEAYRQEGVPIYAVTVQNEPGVNKREDVLSWWYPSCQWSLVEDEDTWWPVPHDIMGVPERDFIRDHLGPEFHKEGIETRIWCYDHNLNNLWYPRNILSDPKAAEFVEGTAFHPYAGKPEAMGEFHGEFPNKDVFLSEGSTRGVKGAARIIEFLRNWARSYNAWVTVADSKGEPNNGPFHAGEPAITVDADTLAVSYNFEYYMYGQFMKFVQRGAVRIDSGAIEPKLSHIAFKNPDHTLVLVLANLDKKPREMKISDGTSSFAANVPAESVSTYQWRP